MRRTPVAFWVCLATVASAAADGPVAPPPAPGAVDARIVDRTVESALAAARAKDAQGLRRLAATEGSDPWLVADALLSRGEAAAAAAFSGAATGKDSEGLAPYAIAYKAPPDDAARRAALATAVAAVAASRWDDALAALGDRGATSASTARAEGARAEGALVDVFAIRAAATRAEALGGLRRGRDAAATFLDAGAAARRLGWLAQAARSLSAGVDLAKKVRAVSLEIGGREALLSVAELHGDARAASAARGELGDAVRRGGDLPKARRILGQAHDELKRLGDALLLAKASLDLSSACGAAGDFEEAFRLAKEGLALFEAQGNAAGVAASLNALGNLHNARGEFAEARAKHEAALARWRAAKAEDGIAIALGNLANDASKVGEYARALGYDEESLALREAQGDRAGIASALASLATVTEALGDRPKALTIARRALAMAEEDQDALAMAELLGQVGALEHAQGDFDAAIAHFQRELEMAERAGREGEAANVFSNLGTVRYSKGELAPSRELLEKALAIETKLGLHSEAIRTQSNLGVVLHRLGRDEEAGAAIEAAVAEADRLRIDESLAYALGHLAGFRMDTREYAAALSAAKRAQAVEARLVSGLGDEQGAFAREAHHGIYETGLNAAAMLDDVREAARFMELGRAGALREALEARLVARSAAVPRDLAAAEDAARATETKAIAAYRAALEGGDRAEIRARREQADAATAAVEAALDRIQRATKRGATLALPQVEDLESLQARLKPGEAFITYTYAGPAADVLVVTPTSARLTGIGKVEAVTRDCEGVHVDDPGVPIADVVRSLGPIGGHLVRRFKLPDEVKRIYVSPEGATAYIPFTLLFPDREIVYEPSYSTYALLLGEGRARGTKILALGDPDYDAVPAAAAAANPTAPPPEPAERSSRDGRGMRLVPLPATRDEAKVIGDIVLLGADASEAGLRAAIAGHAGRFRAIHFACHGLLDPDHPARCALALTSSGADDGYLTARELMQASIPADLVVLSACETAKGHVLRGEGILGLTRAFMYAGAPRVLCSLWKVDDEATRALMVEFYARWKAGAPPVRALGEAQAFVRSQEKWKHPYYWAAWVLWGLPE